MTTIDVSTGASNNASQNGFNGNAQVLDRQALSNTESAGDEPVGLQTGAMLPLGGSHSGDSHPGTFDLLSRMARTERLENLYQVTVSELRKQFRCDRAFIYQFRSKAEGEVIAESLKAGYTPTLGESLEVIAFGAHGLEDYQSQSAVTLSNANEEAISPHQMQLLQRFQVRASLSLPVFLKKQPWGILVVQQCDNPREWRADEVALLFQASTEMTLQLQAHALEEQTQAEIDRGETLANVIQNVREFSDLQQVFESTAKRMRRFLKSDRVAVFQFIPGSSHGMGEVVAESVDPNFVSAKEVMVEDHCFSDNMAEAYRLGRTAAMDDIYKEGLADCYIDVLAQFQVRANLVVPLLKDNQLWGLFCIHQCSGPRQWQPLEVSFVRRVASQLDLAMQQAEYLDQVQEKAQQLEASVEREKLISNLTERLRDTRDLQRTLKATAYDIRRLMKADRVGMYQFDPEKNYSVGEFVVEDVAANVRSAMHTKVQDHCFAEDQAENYRKGRHWVVNDIEELDVSYCLIDLLKELQVRASIVVPLIKGNVLWGLFAIHQCNGPREWQEADVQFAHRIGAQLNIALQQAEYLKQVEEKTAELTEIAAREKASKELLQQQVMQLLRSVGPALEGDLTVRAQVGETEVGTVASAYNNTMQSLQKIVMQVQEAAEQVSESSKLSGGSAQLVSEQAQQQAKALEEALNRVQTVVKSTEAVVEDAQQVEAAATKANQTVEQGDVAMNRAVDGIMTIRSTVAETNQRIKRLSESSQKVSKIVSLISHFTTQTQLLALNASIEATRAGEYGRGFAVVADEVRSLARQSAEAATEIERFVQEIQTGTAEVSTAMEAGIQQVAEGTDLVANARQSLTEIIEATAQIGDLIGHITQTTYQQSDEFKVVTQTMTEATEIATQTSTNTHDLAQSIEQVLGTAEALQTSAARFKV